MLWVDMWQGCGTCTVYVMRMWGEYNTMEAERALLFHSVWLWLELLYSNGKLVGLDAPCACG